jgi:hypothetical protein
MFRKTRPEAVPAPDPGLMRMVETTGAAARAAGTFRDAVAVVLDDVATRAGWPAAHAWLPAAAPGAWESSGLWFPDDGIGLGELRSAVCDSAPAPPRGHLALALHLSSTQWAGDLGALAGTAIGDAATRASIVAALACPVFAGGRPVALLEWYLASPRRLSPDVAHVLGHLSGVLSEVFERPAVVTAPVVSYVVPVPRRVPWPIDALVPSRA